MVGLGLLVVVALVVAAFASWARRHEAAGAGARAPERHTRISLVTEAVGYVGAVLLLSGGIAAVAQSWDRMSDGGRVGLLAAATVLFLAGGVLLRRVPDDAVQRLVGVLWFVSVGAMAATVGVAAHDLFGARGVSILLVVGLGTTAYATALWLPRRRGPQLVALVGASVLAVCGVIATSIESPTTLAFALPLWALGLAWAVLGLRRVTEPMWAAMALGVLLALFAPSVAVADHGWVFAVAIGTAGVFMAVSVPLRNTPLLGVATVAMFGYLTAVLVRYFADSLGVPAVLVAAGLLVLGLAVVSARLGRTSRPAPDDAGRPAGDERVPDRPGG